MPRNLPCCASGNPETMVANDSATSPDITAGMACEPPLNATCNISIFAILVNSAPLRYKKFPDEAYDNWPGRALASAINSLIFFAGTEGCATIRLGSNAVGVTAAKSLTGSYDGLAYNVALIACVPVVPITS